VQRCDIIELPAGHAGLNIVFDISPLLLISYCHFRQAASISYAGYDADDAFMLPLLNFLIAYAARLLLLMR